MKRLVVGLLALLFLLPSACGGGAPTTLGIGLGTEISPVDLDPGEKLQVVATTTIVADVVSNVGGEAVEVVTLIPPGLDPHAYEPTPQDLRAVEDADVVFLTGLGLEASLERLIAGGMDQANVVFLSTGIEVLGYGPSGGQEGGTQAEVDPHVWMDPNNVLVWVGNVATTLTSLDPARSKTFAEMATQYGADLKVLDAWAQEQLSQVPQDGRKLVTDHHALTYFAARYGYEVVGAVIPAYSTVAEPSAMELSRLEDGIRGLGVKAVFVEAGANPILVEQVARDTGVRLVPLYIGSLSGPEGPANSYRALIEYNVKAIVDSLLR